MNCHDFEITVLALARDQLLEKVVREQSLTHAAECTRCAGRLAEERALLAYVHAVVEDIAEEEMPARAETALLNAFREHVSASSSTAAVVIPMTTGHRSQRWLMAAAAMILLLISATTIFRLYSHTQIHEALTVSSMTVKLPAPESKAIKDELAIESPPPALHPQSRVHHRAVPVHRLHESEEVTDFFPLMDGEDLNAMEHVQVVRVEVPASALMDVGIRVSPEMATRPIKADMLVGQDGLAHAIRLVR